MISFYHYSLDQMIQLPDINFPSRNVLITNENTNVAMLKPEADASIALCVCRSVYIIFHKKSREYSRTQLLQMPM